MTDDFFFQFFPSPPQILSHASLHALMHHKWRARHQLRNPGLFFTMVMLTLITNLT